MDAEILAYTRNQRVTGFPAAPPRLWALFIKEGGGEARLWSVLQTVAKFAMTAPGAGSTWSRQT
ncbi:MULTISPECIES: hypothetical protein [unclassified Microbacterium]|uniref:hypothetical protein n=1 Tax=unclassified Microbacterium TaxID=2609290 RepID=UPI001FCE3185|nr:MULTISPECIES: hypothetical protein [unclassified Microbacterium]